MKKAILFSALFALAACNGAETDVDEATASDEMAGDSGLLEGEEPGFEAVAPGTYQVTRPEGQVDYIEIHPGMTFSRVAADGTATGGSIFMKEGPDSAGLTCFLVEGEQEETCFEDGERQPDGSMETVAPDGGVSTVRPVEGSLEDHVGTEQ